MRPGLGVAGTGEPLIERAGGRFDARFSAVSMMGIFPLLERYCFFSFPLFCRGFGIPLPFDAVVGRRGS
jgi:hypothetical protein